MIIRAEPGAARVPVDRAQVLRGAECPSYGLAADPAHNARSAGASRARRAATVAAHRTPSHGAPLRYGGVPGRWRAASPRVEAPAQLLEPARAQRLPSIRYTLFTEY